MKGKGHAADDSRQAEGLARRRGAGGHRLVFVFWGINWTLSAPNYAAKVNGSEISTNEVRQSYQQQLAQSSGRPTGRWTMRSATTSSAGAR
jgi:hypothetical protein